jgi:hypothetical protein
MVFSSCYFKLFADKRQGLNVPPSGGALGSNSCPDLDDALFVTMH